MKKSKVIVPAVAMIAFSTAASIAGSVAWFTASRQAVIQAGTYAVVKTTSNLDVELTAGVGTLVSEKSVTFGDKLTDGSFSHKNGNVYTPNAAGTGLATGDKAEIDIASYDASVASEVAAVAALLERATITENNVEKKVYTAATFDIKFTVNFGAVEGDIGLYLNCTGDNSKFTTGSTASTAKGFRMAFYPLTAENSSEQKAKVFADLQESAKCKYVGGTDNFSGTSYTAGDLMDSSYAATLPTESTDRATCKARNDYLGFFKYKSQSEVSMTYRVVAWFEGTDEEIRNRETLAEYQSVAAQLTFEAIDLKAESTNP